MAAIFVSQNNETAAMFVSQTIACVYSWRYCVLGEGDLAAEPQYQSSESQTPRPHSFFLDRGSAAKTLITHYRQLRRLPKPVLWELNSFLM